MDNLRTRFESLINEVTEEQNRARSTIMRLEADKLELSAENARLTTELAVATAQLAARVQDIEFEPDFTLVLDDSDDTDTESSP